VSVFFEEIMDHVRPTSRKSSEDDMRYRMPSVIIARSLSHYLIMGACHSGHHNLPSSVPCERAIAKQGEDDFETIPNSGITISRTAMRNNSSNYYVNNKKSNFTEVTDLLKAKGVDLNNNRFLILQVCLTQLTLLQIIIM
jgi:hypothetical protein